MNTRLQDKFDQYHTGRMSPEEHHAFERELESDPSLQAESDFQSDIINGLKDYRKLELKSRLNAVDISPVWYDFVQHSTLMKSFGGVAVATLIGTGVFFLAEPRNVETATEVIIDAPTAERPLFSWDIQPAILTEPSVVEDSKPATAFKSQVAVLPVEISEALANETAEAEIKSETFSPDFSAPSAEEILDEESMEVSSLEELPETTAADVASKPIDVDYENTRALDIKYKYYDGKLFLSGDFDRAPYEILEINSADGRRIYVKYLDKFYQVNVTDKLTRLPQVYDVNVIRELQLLRANK